jgi:hypothetical protein
MATPVRKETPRGDALHTDSSAHTLKNRLTKKALINIDGVDILITNFEAVAYVEGLKILPLKQAHIDLLTNHSIVINPQILKLQTL